MSIQRVSMKIKNLYEALTFKREMSPLKKKSDNTVQQNQTFYTGLERARLGS